ncbi:hypothetical protein VM98_36650, partial [Streptomyces rubellomurinus subsp. indigoferus]
MDEMRIRDLGVIDDAVVELAPGFTAGTGEAGGGKTVVGTSRGLLLGGRADPGLVRHGTGRAVVQGPLERPADSRLAAGAIGEGAERSDGALLGSGKV